ncbi:MAG: double zinc ribbon domain-containing protein [Actinomycetota bacterium]|nr:double zinc ribbon domain-containing protein [Actinomycetota bacterium]
MNLRQINLGEALKDLILPPACCVCGRVSTAPLCQDCGQKIEIIGEDICPRCGCPHTPEVCSFCSQQSLYYYRSRSFAYYGDTIRAVIFRYKQQGISLLSGLLASWLELSYNQHYRGEDIEIMDGVPGSHIQMICSHLESRLKIPYANNLLKIRKGQEQKQLDSSTRKFNPVGDYKVRDCLKYYGRNLLLIDDVFTTGSTLNHVCWLAKKAGAAKIYLLTVARGEHRI